MEDAAENFLRALNSPDAAHQTYHIATQEVLTPERWAMLIYQAAGHACAITYVPEKVIQGQEVLKAYSSPLTRPIPYVHDLSRAERDFGFRTTPVAQWVQKTVDWYRAQYKGGPSKGYEHRAAELALMEKWNSAFERFVSQF
ncbi:MAG: hypothetical protein A3F84_14295 [Candidatus Handelsmanbacteria bacterium RIFCSPLOWO2_12_FULL_64_10]|uniref:NAD(P)-binding domain-containing protein n=1 Tax=Handelsmanbacteria sp. (strain RIFCSPLOWO2_12_FULL_64_10) TaxID=1817868 RepID=A0A1F6CID1_HANXR|nr:MAG: hypothetical protein A3F84_14295 [Candidatus Handelsmanbacteria bacterium RIFCSPLOWO2_12_FULL_64_10]